MTSRKATQSGSLNDIDLCYIIIPGVTSIPSNVRKQGLEPGVITMNNLPDISDSKDAVYNGESIIGRSAPLYTYAYSGDRNISMQLHFFVVDKDDGILNLTYLRWLQSAVYPRTGDGDNGVAPFKPPPICRLKCGDLLAQGDPVCAILKSYNVKFPTDVAFDTNSGTFCPFRFDVDTSWTVVYTSSNLPFQDRIIKSGY